ncbi:MAG: riboflavin biosynthesis protein RibF [Deferribacteraceae bacterium]|jgi:riboflavin kinase/FMN adenylyltransferase|nr:riboflavin biosynthesis protein RibF [Deferribacteraceae bacterium]
MQVVLDGSILATSKTAVCIGNFDGVHLGHASLLQAMLARGLAPVVCTFLPHPQKYYKKNTPMICTFEQKMALLASAGVEICYNVPFNAELAALEPSVFFREYIEERLHAKAVIVGSDFRFGKGRTGDSVLLKRLCLERNIECIVVPQLEHGGVQISSTVIRNIVLAGDVAEVPNYLGRYYSCVGEVVAGDQMGRTIGFPTANLKLLSELLPPEGVYSGYTYVDGKRYTAMIYRGTRPEVGERFEVHLVDYSGRELYGDTLEVFIVQKIRDCMKFSSLEELKEQLERDKEKIL